MCNLYSITKNRDAIRRLFRVTQDSSGNLPSMLASFRITKRLSFATRVKAAK